MSKPTESSQVPRALYRSGWQDFKFRILSIKTIAFALVLILSVGGHFAYQEYDKNQQAQAQAIAQQQQEADKQAADLRKAKESLVQATGSAGDLWQETEGQVSNDQRQELYAAIIAAQTLIELDIDDIDKLNRERVNVISQTQLIQRLQTQWSVETLSDTKDAAQAQLNSVGNRVDNQETIKILQELLAREATEVSGRIALDGEIKQATKELKASHDAYVRQEKEDKEKAEATKAPAKAPTKAPVPAKTQAPSKAPAPTKAPAKAPTKAPAAPQRASSSKTVKCQGDMTVTFTASGSGTVKLSGAVNKTGNGYASGSVKVSSGSATVTATADSTVSLKVGWDGVGTCSG